MGSKFLLLGRLYDILEGLTAWSGMLLPLGLYLLWLGLYVHGRSRPMLLPGHTDRWVLFLGLSGFFLAGPPTWILYGFLPGGMHVYWVAYGLYCLLLLLYAALLAAREARSLVIYNVDPAAFLGVLQQVLHTSDVAYYTVPGRIIFDDGITQLEIEGSQRMQTVKLTWTGQDSPHRTEIEEYLKARLNECKGRRPEVGLLLSLAGMALLALAILGLVWAYT